MLDEAHDTYIGEMNSKWPVSVFSGSLDALHEVNHWGHMWRFFGYKASDDCHTGVACRVEWWYFTSEHRPPLQQTPLNYPCR